jgi:hypothetical protein
MISDALDGALSRRRAVSLERHLKDCAACRAYREDVALLDKSAEGLADPGLTPGDWVNWSRGLETRLSAAVRGSARGDIPFFFRWKWAWAGASFAVLAFIVTYFAVLRPRGGQELIFVSFEDSVAQALGEIGANSELENSFNREILASIDEAVRPADEEPPPTFGDNPLFWEGLSEGELGYIESALRQELGHGGLS